MSGFDVVKEIAGEIGHTPSQVALAWTLLNPAVTAPLVGARTLQQLEENLGALEVVLNAGQRQKLEDASRLDLGFPHEFLARPMTQAIMTGGLKIDRRVGG